MTRGGDGGVAAVTDVRGGSRGRCMRAALEAEGNICEMSLSSVDDDHVEGERLLGDQRALKVHHVGLRVEASR
eukprot:CAMPEP_0179874798 /NCGR_PEP_ID=MMETSP0982-20121206/23104_1 /TAXON_ID=483367 /ORGANISM="non described non described, Strain CCMP 2436" /LENGTH=72 /DNA_ID=CAMNT_0021766665 /DNA_START=100 /DNA_END=315 /DNA_ORIENTATION=+